MGHLPMPISRASALVRAYELAAVYPEGVTAGSENAFYDQTLAVLLEAMELTRELRERAAGRRVLANSRMAAGQAIGLHASEQEVSGVLLVDDLNCLIAETLFDPCLPRAYRRKGRLSVESAAATVVGQVERHGATGVIVFHLTRSGPLPWGESHELIGRLRQEARPRGLRLLDYLVISPPTFQSLRGWPAWEHR